MEPVGYEIQIKGQLLAYREAWFPEMSICHNEQGNTILSGLVVDQTALFGLLDKIRDLGLVLISVYPSTPPG